MLNIGNSNALQGESSSSSFKHGSEFCPNIVGRNEELVGGQFDASREKVVQWKKIKSFFFVFIIPSQSH